MGKTFSEQLDIFIDESLLLEEACKTLGELPDCGGSIFLGVRNEFYATD